jgi:hypothetical protein
MPLELLLAKLGGLFLQLQAGIVYIDIVLIDLLFFPN